MNARRERGTGRIFPRGNILWIQYYVHGEPVRVSAKTDDRKKAAKFLRMKLAEVETGIHRDARRLNYEELREAFYQEILSNWGGPVCRRLCKGLSPAYRLATARISFSPERSEVPAGSF